MFVQGIDDDIAKWVYKLCGGGRLFPGQGRATGYATPARGLIAGAVFHSWNGTCIMVDVAVKPGERLPLDLLWFIGEYGFGQLKARGLLLQTDSTNIKAQRFHDQLGAVKVATIPGMARGGADILLSVLYPDANIWRKLNGRQIRRTRSCRLQTALEHAERDESNGDRLANSGEPNELDRTSRIG